MKAILRDFLTAFLMGFVLPSIMMGAAVFAYETHMTEQPELTEPISEEQQISYPMLMRSGNTVEEGDLDTYLVGVILAEMPADFETEALKAQAVAARTYARKAYETGGKHGDGSVCTESSCCQAYISPADYVNQGGTQEGLEKVRSAVEATSGLVLTYEGQLIEATYFSCSGGRTEDAVAVWGTEYPYLQSVPSPGEEAAAYHRDTVSFTPEAFSEALGFVPEGKPGEWFGLTEYTDGGSVETIVIGDEVFSGTQLRSLLGLRSAAFTVEVLESAIRITTRGYGHRVGMSQYGADAMAVQGNSYADILSHYYPGTELSLLEIGETEP